MTSPAFPYTLPSGAGFASYPVSQEDIWDPINVPTESGAVEIRSRYDAPLRSWRLIGSNFTKADMDYVMGFLYERLGGGNYFYITIPQITVYSPFAGPTTATTTSGAIGARTYYVSYAWSDGTDTTDDSAESSQAIAGNDLIEVTVPSFPDGVTEARVYMGTASGTLTFCGTISSTGGTFTEPFSTVDADSASGQKILNLAATTNFESGQTIIIGEGTAREETKVIDTVQAGVSITMTANLDYTHTAVQADEAYLDPGTGTLAPTSNTLDSLEWKARMIGEPQKTEIGTGVYNVQLDIEQVRP